MLADHRPGGECCEFDNSYTGESLILSQLGAPRPGLSRAYRTQEVPSALE
jgi:hypothetical protein